MRYCSLPEAIREYFLWGAGSVVVAGTHGKTTTTSLAGWLLTHGGLDPTVLVGGIALNFGDGGSSYRVGRGPRLRHRRRRVRQRVLRQDREVPEVPARDRRRQQHRVRSRRHLCGSRRGPPGVPPPREPRAAQRPAAAGRRQPRCAALKARRVSPVETFGLGEGARGGATDIGRRDGLTRFDVQRERPVVRRVRVAARSARTTSATRWPPSPSARACGLDAPTLRRRAARVQGIKRRLEIVGERRGVTVLDDFAHHPTAVARDARGARDAAIPDARCGRCSSRARRRRAAGCSRTTSPARSAPPTRW